MFQRPPVDFPPEAPYHPRPYLEMMEHMDPFAGFPPQQMPYPGNFKRKRPGQPANVSKKAVNEVVCPLCGAFCPNEHALIGHLNGKRHTDGQKSTENEAASKVICPVCCEVCPNKDALVSHLKNGEHKGIPKTKPTKKMKGVKKPGSTKQMHPKAPLGFKSSEGDSFQVADASEEEDEEEEEEEEEASDNSGGSLHGDTGSVFTPVRKRIKVASEASAAAPLLHPRAARFKFKCGGCYGLNMKDSQLYVQNHLLQNLGLSPIKIMRHFREFCALRFLSLCSRTEKTAAGTKRTIPVDELERTYVEKYAELWKPTGTAKKFMMECSDYLHGALRPSFVTEEGGTRVLMQFVSEKKSAKTAFIYNFLANEPNDFSTFVVRKLRNRSNDGTERKETEVTPGVLKKAGLFDILKPESPLFMPYSFFRQLRVSIDELWSLLAEFVTVRTIVLVKICVHSVTEQAAVTLGLEELKQVYTEQYDEALEQIVELGKFLCSCFSRIPLPVRPVMKTRPNGTSYLECKPEALLAADKQQQWPDFATFILYKKRGIGGLCLSHMGSKPDSSETGDQESRNEMGNGTECETPKVTSSKCVPKSTTRAVLQAASDAFMKSLQGAGVEYLKYFFYADFPCSKTPADLIKRIYFEFVGLRVAHLVGGSVFRTKKRTLSLSQVPMYYTGKYKEKFVFGEFGMRHFLETVFAELPQAIKPEFYRADAQTFITISEQVADLVDERIVSLSFMDYFASKTRVFSWMEGLEQEPTEPEQPCTPPPIIPNVVDQEPPDSSSYVGFLESVGLDFLRDAIAQCSDGSEMTEETLKELYAEFLMIRFVHLIAGQKDPKSGLQNTVALSAIPELYNERYKEELQYPDNLTLTTFLQSMFDLVLPVFSPILFENKSGQQITISDQAAAFVDKMPEPTDFFTFFVSKTSTPNSPPNKDEIEDDIDGMLNRHSASTKYNAE